MLLFTCRFGAVDVRFGSPYEKSDTMDLVLPEIKTKSKLANESKGFSHMARARKMPQVFP